MTGVRVPLRAAPLAALLASLAGTFAAARGQDAASTPTGAAQPAAPQDQPAPPPTPQAPAAQAAPASPALPGAPGAQAATPPAVDWTRKPRQYKTEMRLALDEAVHLGLANNLDIRLSRLDDQIRNRDLVIAKAAFDPFFNLGSSYAKNRDPTLAATAAPIPTVDIAVNPSEALNYYSGIGGKWFLGTTYDLTLSQTERDNPSLNSFSNLSTTIAYTSITATIRQPLLRGAWYGVNLAEVRIAENNRQVSREQLLLTAMSTVFAIEKAYWELLFAIQNYDSKTKALQVTVENLENVRKKRAVGTLAAIDVTTAESQAALRRVELDDAEQTRELARDQLLRLINYSKEQSMKEAWEDGRRIGPFDEIMILCSTQPEEARTRVDRDVALVSAFLKRPEYRQTELNVENQEIRLEVARNSLLPTVDVLGSWRQLGLEDSFGSSFEELGTGKYYDWLAGVEMSIPLGNRGARSAYRNTRDELRKLKVSKADLENIIVLDVDQAIRRIQHLERKVDDLDERVRLQAELLRAERRKLDVGMSIPYTVSVIENDLVDSQTQALLAKANLNIARAQLWLVTGEILERHRISVEGAVDSQ